MADSKSKSKSTSRPSPQLSSPTLRSATQSTGESSLRSRGRHQTRSSNNASDQESAQPFLRDSSPLPAAHNVESDVRGHSSPRRAGISSNQGGNRPGAFGQFLGDSWNQSWSSLQSLAASMLAAGDEPIGTIGRSQGKISSSNSTNNHWGWNQSGNGNSSSNPVAAWGPPPPSSKHGADDVAIGSYSEREAALKAARTASVLESHEGVNGGLDIMGNFKRRRSDEMAPTSSQPEEYLVYIHKVQSTDTYAGLILRYKCRGDAFKKANGLWSNDSIQMRKWLAFPVDACELRGRPWEAPSSSHAPIRTEGSDHDQPFHHSDAASGKKELDWDLPWTHVKWVKMESFPEPVEVGRVSRQAMGYFPPRRKRSTTTTSSVAATTPRQSLDIASPAFGPVERRPSRRHSSLSAQPQLPESSTPSRGPDGHEDVDTRPSWMRRPGGVGSMGRHVRAPGPEKDYLNTWMEKHIPSLNIDEMPSMSIMGSETARLGFGHDPAGLVESPFVQGRGGAVPEMPQTIGLDKAAAAVEAWVRGALSKRAGTPMMSTGTRGGAALPEEAEGDLIELSETPGEDVRASSVGSPADRRGESVLASSSQGTNARTGGVRSRKDVWGLY